MKPSLQPIALALLFFLVLFCKKEQVSVKNFDEIEKLAAIMESPERKAWQKPDEIVEMIGLKNGDIIGDIGAGTGYFSRRFARKVAPEGKAIGYDIEPLMVQYMKRDAEIQGLSENYHAEIISSRHPKLSNEKYDVLFFCNTWQYLQKPVEYFKSLRPALKPKGRIIIIDFIKMEKTPSEARQPSEKAKVIKMLKEAKYTLSRDFKFLPSQFFLEFKPSK